MSVKEKLQIILITYNRAKYLKETLEQILADNSPIRNYDITILDNASTDETFEVCQNYCNIYPNITYIKNKINVGISGNIIKAMELASKEWFWVICDDDKFDWTNWREVEDAILSDKYDIVHTTFTEGYRSEEYAYLINEESFIPTVIYRTSLVDMNVLQNAYTMAYTLLPHHAIGCKVINQKGAIFVPQNRHVIQGSPDCNEKDWIRTEREGIFHRLNNFQLLAGYIGAYALISDPIIREKCCNVLCLGSDFLGSMNWFLDTNPRKDLYNIFEILLTVNEEQRKQLVELLYLKNYKNFLDLINEVSFTIKERNAMAVREKLQIILITYNRSKFVQQTLEQFFYENSPVKDYDFLVLDNNSTDDTKQIVDKWSKMYPNITYLKNNYNLGISGNIAKAMEIADKEYVWIIGDDDRFDWTNWEEVENAINNKEKIICVSRYGLPDSAVDNIPAQIGQLTFITGGIFSTELYTDTIMRDTFDNIYTLFPHLVPVMHAINDNIKIYVVKKAISDNNMQAEEKDCSYTRGMERKHLSPRTSSMNWWIGYANICQIIKNKSLATAIFMNGLNSPCICGGEDACIKIFKKYFHDGLLGPVADVYTVAPGSLKKKIQKFVKTYYFQSSRTKRIKNFWQKIFSIKDEGKHRVYHLLGLKLSFRKKG